MKIYVASSWRNELQPDVVNALRNAEHEVYDFKNPPNGTGFAWSSIDEDWQNWNTIDYNKALTHPLAEVGYKSDFDAMQWADACVLVLPSGRSAHSEAGWFAGQGKPVIVITNDKQEPELMYKMFYAVHNNTSEVIDELIKLNEPEVGIIRVKINGMSDLILSIPDYNAYESLEALLSDYGIEREDINKISIDTMKQSVFDGLGEWEG